MKRLLPLFFLLAYNLCLAQSGTWTWMNGTSTIGAGPSYGTKGVPSATTTPSSLYEPIEWTDKKGNLWLFGGRATSGEYNTLWKYDPKTNMWTWIGGSTTLRDQGNRGVMGVPSPSNWPQSKSWGAFSWVDTSGNFWMYGGSGTTICYNDVWMYNTTTGEWTWYNGGTTGSVPPSYTTLRNFAPTNDPGGRDEANSCWTVGNLAYVFGGRIVGNVSSHDMWAYDMSIHQWALMHGPSGGSGPGKYGTKGVEDSSNYPPGRESYNHWKDKQGNLWFFAGNTLGGSLYNDMWRYNPTNDSWTWMSGTNLNMNKGYYGKRCVPSVNKIPASRQEDRAFWTDPQGYFWIFGGIYYGGGTRNDMWCFCPVSNEWTWTTGDSTYSSPGNFGTKNVPSPTNVPPGLNGAVGWTDSSGALYLFGGSSNGFNNVVNTLWKYVPDYTCMNPCGLAAPPPVALFNANPRRACAPACFQLNNLSTNATTYKWTFNGGTPATTTIDNPQVCYNTPGSYTVQLIAINASGTDTTFSFNYLVVDTVSQAGNVVSSKDTICEGTGLTSLLSVGAGVGDIQWQESLNGVTFTDIPGATVSNYSTSPFMSQTTYFRALVQKSPCPADTSNIVIVHIVPAPTASFTISGSTTTVNFTSTTSGNVIFYSWDFGDGGTSSSPNPTHTYAVIDTYSVCLTVYNSSNCSFTFCRDVIPGVIDGVWDISLRPSFTLHPNPAHNQLTIQAQQLSPGSELILTDLLGRELRNISATQKETIIDVSDLAASVYFLTLKTTEGSVTKKFVKE